MAQTTATQQNDGEISEGWYSFKHAAERGEFHLGLEKMLGVTVKERLRPLDFYARLAQTSFIEAGFVPLVDSVPVVPVDELQSMGHGDRMLKLLGKLTSVIHSGRDDAMSSVQYTFVRQEEEPTVDEEEIGSGGGEGGMLAYSQHVMTIYISNVNGSIVSQAIFRDGTGISMNDNWINYVASNWEVGCPYTAMEYLTTFNFDVMKFSDTIKKSLLYEVLDKYNLPCTGIRGFEDLPPELLVKIGNKLDTRSFVKFISTNKRHNQVLDTDLNWNSRLLNVTEELQRYGLRPPTDDVVRDATISAKSNYKALYLEAVQLSRARRRERRRERAMNIRQNIFGGRFGHCFGDRF